MITSGIPDNTERRIVLSIPFLMLLIVGMLIVILSTPGALGDTIYVDDDASEGGNGTLAQPFNSIQNATDNASAGDTIRVFAGTYHENVVASITVTIIGNGTDVTIVNASGSSTAIRLNGEWSNLSDIQVTGSGTGFWDAGVRVEGDNITVTNIFSTGNRYGINVRNSRDVLVTRNNATGNNLDGINLLNSDYCSVANNSCSSNRYGINLWNAEFNTIRDNNCSANVRGISFDGSLENILDMNEILDNENGIHIQNSDKNSITSCIIRGNENGIYLEESSSQNVATTNEIIGNTVTGVNASQNNGQTIDARYNRWGDDSGPFHAGINPDGKGDNVTDNVQFSPWTGKAKKVYNQDSGEYFMTVAQAIENATAGDTIQLFEGVFGEQVVIDRRITLIGNGSEVTTLVFGGNGDVVSVQADGVSISMLRIRGSGSGPGGGGIKLFAANTTIQDTIIEDHDMGVEVANGAEGTSINGNTFTGNEVGILLNDVTNADIMGNSFSTHLGNAIASYGSSGNTVSGNTFSLNQGVAVIYLSSSPGNTLVNNTFGNNSGFSLSLLKSDGNAINGNDIYNASSGIVLDQSDDMILHYNRISHCSDEGIRIIGSTNISIENGINELNRIGIFIGEGCSDIRLQDVECRENDERGIHITIADYITISDTTCEENQIGLMISRSDNIEIISGNYHQNDEGIQIYDSRVISAEAVTIQQNVGSGANLSEVTDLHITHSIIDQNGGPGIEGNRVTGISIINNTITDNSVGVTLTNHSMIDIHGNNILDSNDHGLLSEDDGSEPIDATNNFWGDPSGPYHAQNNSDGTGDEVSNGVLFDPWMDELRIWAIITQADPEEVIEGEGITFDGYGISHYEQIDQYRWFSSIDGNLYDGADSGPMAFVLSNGTHVISFTATNEGGHVSDPAQVSVHVNGIPRVSLDDFPAWALEGEDLLLEGDVDEDSGVYKYVWISDKEGILYNGMNPGFIWKGLSKGHRILSFFVIDDHDVVSETVQVSFDVYSQPKAFIDSITPGSPIHDSTIELDGRGTASNPIVRYLWESNISGVLYDGPNDSFILPGLENGTHTISLTIVDQVGIWSEPVTRIISVNLRPTAVIESISPNPGVPGDSITFVANGTDDGIIKQYAWYSDLDGVLSNGTTPSFSTSHLIFGTHIISLFVKDDEGVWSLPANTTFVLTMKPTAFIESISPNPVTTGEGVTLQGNGSDDGSISSIRWTSSIDGILITTTRSSVTITDLSPGIHTISLTVLDDLGVWSDPVSTSLEVLDNAPPTISLTFPEQNAIIEGSITIKGTASDDEGVGRVEYHIEGEENWKAVPRPWDSWELLWDSERVANGTIIMVFRSFDGLLYSDEITLTLDVQNSPVDPMTITDDDDGPDILLLIASFGLILMILAAIALFIRRSRQPAPPGQSPQPPQTKALTSEGEGKQPGKPEETLAGKPGGIQARKPDGTLTTLSDGFLTVKSGGGSFGQQTGSPPDASFPPAPILSDASLGKDPTPPTPSAGQTSPSSATSVDQPAGDPAQTEPKKFKKIRRS